MHEVGHSVGLIRVQRREAWRRDGEEGSHIGENDVAGLRLTVTRWRFWGCGPQTGDMDTTLASHESFDDEVAAERARTTRGGALVTVLTIGAALVAVLLVGAVTLQFTGQAIAARTAPAFARLVALAVALVAVVALPLWWERHRRRAWRKIDPLLRRRRVSWVLPWSVLLAVAIPLTAPDLARASLTTHGAWMVPGGSTVIERATTRATSAVARAIPLQTALTVTHRTLWPWVDRNSPECRVPAATAAR